jgi:cyclic beta-1,2-glucan synthetase
LLALPDPLAEAQRNGTDFELLLHQASDELVSLLPETAATPSALPSPNWRDELAWRLADHLATLRSALWDLQAAAAPEHTVHRLRTIASAFEELAWSADYSFLYHRKRHLFHIGYRVAEQELDAGFYDLLASESRLTSLLAIAKGDVPVRHWASLGRPFYAVGTEAGLRSWSGSMFEYLMPTLVLHEPHGSVLRNAGHASIREQISFARAHSVPWGISESAYAGRDHTLAYQYAPQGVPRLALRRTPPDELVIAPYATALAAQIAPHSAAANFAVMQSMAARARYGFIEALDFTSTRLSSGEAYAPVSTFMAHHQGMSIVSLANVLLKGRRSVGAWPIRTVEAVASLLHERRRAKCRCFMHHPPVRRRRPCNAVAQRCCVRSTGRVGHRADRMCCRTAATASRCDPTVPAGAAVAPPASRARATMRCAMRRAASSTCAGTGAASEAVPCSSRCRSPSTRHLTRPPRTRASSTPTACASTRRGPACKRTPRCGSARKTTSSSARSSCATSATNRSRSN